MVMVLFKEHYPKISGSLGIWEGCNIPKVSEELEVLLPEVISLCSSALLLVQYSGYHKFPLGKDYYSKLYISGTNC